MTVEGDKRAEVEETSRWVFTTIELIKTKAFNSEALRGEKDISIGLSPGRYNNERLLRGTQNVARAITILL
jgi:hypothetical protein